MGMIPSACPVFDANYFSIKIYMEYISLRLQDAVYATVNRVTHLVKGSATLVVMGERITGRRNPVVHDEYLSPGIRCFTL